MTIVRCAAAAALTLALAGCTFGNSTDRSTPPSPVPSSSSSTDPATSTPEPGAAVAELVLDGSGFSLVDADGDVDFTHHWADEVGPAVVALEAAIGHPPVMGFEEHSGGHLADFDRYEWDGLTLGDAVGLEKPRTDYFLPSWIEATAPTIAGIAVRTTSGVTVGSPVTSVVAIEPRLREQWTETSPVVYKVDAVDPAVLDMETEATDTVGAFADPADATIERLRAPVLSRQFF